MSSLEENSFDTCITDPPSGINFMGKDWDHLSSYSPKTERAKSINESISLLINNKCISNADGGFLVFTVDWCSALMRVLKPGAQVIVWALPRTSDLTKFGMRLAGLDIRDTIYHLFGSGYPKSHNISKAIDKSLGATRAPVGLRSDGKGTNSGSGCYQMNDGKSTSMQKVFMETAPATEEAALWDGWGTALKPAAEEWILAMNPITGTFAKNALDWGVAGLNVDGGRIGDPPGYKYNADKNGTTFHGEQGDRIRRSADKAGRQFIESTKGRWPANVILDEEAAAVLDKQTGSPVSRFFYCAKASTAERNAGLDELEKKVTHSSYGEFAGTPEHASNSGVPRANLHPTVKPLTLLEYFCVITKTPTGGKIIDPFIGSGSTCVAADNVGRECVGIEADPEYFEIAKARVSHTAPQRKIIL